MNTTRPFLKQFLAASALSCAATSTLLGACASDETSAPTPADAAVVPTQDAGPGDGGSDAEIEPCTKDCEYFPDTCAPDTLCSNGLFDPTNSSVGLDWRTRINAIGGRSASDVWAVGAVGTVARFDGTTWSLSDIGATESQRALWLAGSGEISIGSNDNFYLRGIDAGDPGDAGVSAGGWSRRPSPSPPSGYTKTFTATWSTPGSNVLWMATARDVWRVRLTAASALETLPGIPSSVCATIPCKGLRSIHAVSPKTLWAVGDVGAAVRITDADGDNPTANPLNSLTWVGLAGVWAASDTDVWAVGGSGTIRHYTGDALRWNVVENVPTTENLNAIWGSSSSDVWAVGNAGVVLHYDGTTWSRVKIAGLGTRRPELYAVWSPEPGHVWIGGQGILVSLGGKP